MYKQIFYLTVGLFFLLCLPVLVLAEDISITTYYPSPYGSYKNLNVYNQDESGTQTDFTQAVTKAGLLITTDYTNTAYTPGIFWSTQDNNPTKPKAGIYLQETSNGTNMYFGTSNDYATGITNNAIVIDLSGNVGVGTVTPLAKLEVNGDFIRTITRAQGYNQADGTDSGAIATRTLSFVKKQAATGIRVSYSDGRRVNGASIGARWEAKFNGASCGNPGPLAWDIHSGSSGDYHRADATIGTCFGLVAGTYTIQIYVGPAPGYAVTDLYTGWQGIWSLEAEEVR